MSETMARCWSMVLGPSFSASSCSDSLAIRPTSRVQANSVRPCVPKRTKPREVPAPPRLSAPGETVDHRIELIEIADLEGQKALLAESAQHQIGLEPEHVLDAFL